MNVLTYLKYILIALDQLLNTVLLGFPDETLSSRAYRTEQEGYRLGGIIRPIIDTLLFFDPEHCRTSYETEMTRKQFPIEMQ